jgi:hypothetical protein
MISKLTAMKIHGICDEIDACKQALAMMKGKKAMYTDTPSIYFAYENKDKDGFSVLLLRDIAKEAVEKQLKALEGEYSALNNDALTEAKKK